MQKKQEKENHHMKPIEINRANFFYEILEILIRLKKSFTIQKENFFI